MPGVCGAGPLHARQRRWLLERVEPLGGLHTSEQQRYNKQDCKTLNIHLASGCFCFKTTLVNTNFILNLD